jgi:hypothetical protein
MARLSPNGDTQQRWKSQRGSVQRRPPGPVRSHTRQLSCLDRLAARAKLCNNPFRSNVDNLLPFFHVERGKTDRVGDWLSIIDFALWREAHDHILVQESRISRRRLNVTADSKYLPWPSTDEAFSGH